MNPEHIVERAERMRFHRRCGDRVTLLNDNTTAIRNFIEFNHGLILSENPLEDDVLFEVIIDRKVNAWDGSLEIGVTTLDPECLELPATANKLQNTAWILSGNTIFRDGSVIVRSYGPETSCIPQEGDRLGVMRTSRSELMFFWNGSCMGVAVNDMPRSLFAVIDLYGQCVQVTITHPEILRPVIEQHPEGTSADPNNDDSSHGFTEIDINAIVNRAYHKLTKEYHNNIAVETACVPANADCLRFHPRCGILIQLTANNKIAERARPLDDYNNGVVMTHRPLFDGEFFEIKIEQLVDKWSGSIEVGVTTHNPATIRFPSTMTNMDTGTIMMSGCKILVNGHGTNTEYGTSNLDELREGDTVGMMRSSRGELHYFINGCDMGVASNNIDPTVWGVVDLYGMTVKVSIVDPCESTYPVNAAAPRAHRAILPRFPPLQGPPRRIDTETLLFHSLRDSNVTLLNHGSTAHRPNAFELYNNGIVMTNRTLRSNELFQVRLDLVITKWAGSIEIGVTQLSCNEIRFPFKLSNPHSATWAMSGEDVTWDGLVLVPQYVRNLSRLREGDTVGVMRKDTGTVHFFLNGVDLGPAAFEVPDHVFGIIDLYGRAAQATIVDAYVAPNTSRPESPLSTESNATVYPDMCFHRFHGRNARLSRNRLSAYRATVNSEFNDAVLFSSRPLRECEMFEIRIDMMVDCWIGSLEIGVTSIKPEQLETQDGIAGTATDLTWDTYILSGSAVIKDGECVRGWYPLDLDTLTIGSRVGLMWHPDRSLHFYLDGMDQGKAWYVPHVNIYAVVDLYGQCTQNYFTFMTTHGGETIDLLPTNRLGTKAFLGAPFVYPLRDITKVTIMQNEERHFTYNGHTTSEISLLSNTRSFVSPLKFSFSEYCGANAAVMHEFTRAKRLHVNDPEGALVFSSGFLAPGDMFEIRILGAAQRFNGSLRIGVTDTNILNAHVNRYLPRSIKKLPRFTAYIDGNELYYSKYGSGKLSKVKTVTPTLEWLRPGDRIGLRKCPTNPTKVEIFFNFELLDTHIENVPDKVFVVIELFGQITKIEAIPRPPPTNTSLMQPFAPTEETSEQSSKLMAVVPFFAKATNHALGPAFDKSTLATVTPKTPISTSAPTTPTVVTASEVGTATLATVAMPGCSGIGTANSQSRKRRYPVPYTFHKVHGKNIRLCSSDTVATRTHGYKDGVVFVSQPLRRGYSIKFRVDKISGDWDGSVAIGAVAALPSDSVPESAMCLECPAWMVSSELRCSNRAYVPCQNAAALAQVTENSVISLSFRFSGALVVELDGKPLVAIGSVPSTNPLLYPVIDLYGKVFQVSVIFHPNVTGCGASLDLPIKENIKEDLMDSDEETLSHFISLIKRRRALSQGNVRNESQYDLQQVQSPTSNGPIRTIAPAQQIANDGQERSSLHHSLVREDHRRSYSLEDEFLNQEIRKSHSAHNFLMPPEETHVSVPHIINVTAQEVRPMVTILVPAFSDEEPPRAGDEQAAEQQPDSEGEACGYTRIDRCCDTNIQQNDQYPEANDDETIEAECSNSNPINPLTLGSVIHLLDLTDEEVRNLIRSIVQTNLGLPPNSSEEIEYLTHLMSSIEVEDDEEVSEWDATEDGCEHLHLVLKFVNHLLNSNRNMKKKLMKWGQMRCYCSSCLPDTDSNLAGWVRLESRQALEEGREHQFWAMEQGILAHMRFYCVRAAAADIVRPEVTAAPVHAPTTSDIWLDEEGKPHHTVTVIEILQGTEPCNDSLAGILIYLQSLTAFNRTL